MSNSFETWKQCYETVQPLHDALAWIVRIVYLSAMILVLLFLCIKRRGVTQGHVFLQLALEMTNIIVLIFALYL